MPGVGAQRQPEYPEWVPVCDGRLGQCCVCHVFKALLDVPVALCCVVGGGGGEREDLGPPDAVPGGPAWGHGQLGTVALRDKPVFNEWLAGFGPDPEKGPVQPYGPESPLGFPHEAYVEAGGVRGSEASVFHGFK